METPGHIEELRVVGGNVALDFCNTVDGVPGREPGFDSLSEYRDLVAWGVKAGVLGHEKAASLLLRAESAEAKASMARALEVRDLVYRIFLVIAEGWEPSRAELDALERIERRALAGAVLVGSRLTGYQWWWSEDEGTDAPLNPVVHAAVGLLADGDLTRIKRCVACRWLFLDESKNRSRRWCSMEVCGTHEKMRRYVARRAAKREGPNPTGQPDT